MLAIVLALPSATLAQTEIIVDNLDSNTTVTGTWTSSGGPSPWAGSSVFSEGAGEKLFRWLPDVPVAGVYNVYAWWTYHINRSTLVPYRIGHAGVVDTVTVNQRDPALGGDWILLGSFTFDGPPDP